MIDVSIIPVAEASVETLMKSIDRVIINPIIFFLFALALLYFLYGVASYLIYSDSEEVKKTNKSHMIWGIIGLFIMVAVFGIQRLILRTIGNSGKINISDNGDYQVNNYDLKDPNRTEYQLSGGALDDIENKNSNAVDLSNGLIDPSNPYATRNASSNPFPDYISSSSCYRKVLYYKAKTEYQAIAGVRDIAKATIALALGGSKYQSAEAIAFNIVVLYDKTDKLYYAWMDARVPTGDGKPSNCILLKVDPKQPDNLALTNTYGKPLQISASFDPFAPYDDIEQGYNDISSIYGALSRKVFSSTMDFGPIAFIYANMSTDFKNTNGVVAISKPYGLLSKQYTALSASYSSLTKVLCEKDKTDCEEFYQKKYETYTKEYDEYSKKFDSMNREYGDSIASYGDLSQEYKDLAFKFKTAEKEYLELSKKYGDTTVPYLELSKKYGELSASYDALSAGYLELSH